MGEKKFRFSLEGKRNGRYNRFTCPNCGHPKEFTRYIDNETGEYLHEDCGVCNRKYHCNYSMSPRELFEKHPELRPKHEKTWSLSDHYYYKKTRANIMPVRSEVDNVQTEFFDIEWAEKALKRECTFTKWLKTLPFDAERIQQVIDEYYVGGSGDDVHYNGINYGRAVVFWMIDEQMRVHDAKLMAYQNNGHRLATRVNWLRSICENCRNGPQIESTEKILFGLHLINRYPDRNVCIVESEKTALICACRYPEYLWLATGGCANLQPSKLRLLKNRHVALFPDSGELEKWTECAEKGGLRSYNVWADIEQYVSNTDIADVILGEAVLKDEAKNDDLEA